MVTPADGRLFVWDASALLHVGKAGRLDVLGTFATGLGIERWHHVMTELVAAELDRHGVEVPAWCSIFIEDVEHPTPDDLRYGIAYARWVQLTSKDGIHNTGEASAAALVEVKGGIVITDDKSASRAINRNGLEAHGMLWILGEKITAGELDETSASNFADAVKAAGARFPFERHGFLGWARQRRLIP